MCLATLNELRLMAAAAAAGCWLQVLQLRVHGALAADHARAAGQRRGSCSGGVVRSIGSVEGRHGPRLKCHCMVWGHCIMIKG